MDKQIQIIGVEDFIAMKIFAGSAKDIDDVKGVLAVSRKHIDFSLTRKLSLRFGKRNLAKLETLLGR